MVGYWTGAGAALQVELGVTRKHAVKGRIFVKRAQPPKDQSTA